MRARQPDGTGYAVIKGSGHAPLHWDPVKANLLIRAFVGSVAHSIRREHRDARA